MVITTFKFKTKCFFINSELSTADPEKLYAAFQGVMPNDGNVVNFMSSWVEQAVYPILNVNVSSDRKTVEISQKRFLRNNPTHHDDTLWRIPITFATNNINSNFSQTKPSMFLITKSQQIYFEEPIEWIIFNVQQSGSYYSI